MKKEVLIFTIIFIVLSLLIHFEQWLNAPIVHLSNLENSGAYGLGLFHPFVFVSLIYIILLIPRVLTKFLMKKQ